MLIALIVTYFLLGGSESNLELLPVPKDVDKRLESTITDTEQRKEIQKIVDEAAKEMNNINERLLKIHQKGRNLNLNYTSNEEDFKPLIADVMNERKVVQKTLTDLHFQLRDKMTEEQWIAIFGKDEEDEFE